MPRVMKQVNKIDALVRKTKQIMDDFSDFTDGINLLMLIHRAKEGAERANNDKVKKIIVRNKQEYEDRLYELLLISQESEIPYRIYASSAPRNMEKAIHKFKQEQLDADYYCDEDKHSFYVDSFNRFFGCLSSPNSADGKVFLVDLDSAEEDSECLKQIGEAGLNDNIIKRYYTKNGTHIVMDPFNPALLGRFAENIHKDGLILLNY